MSDQAACRKTSKDKLQPTPEQERERERVVMRCRRLSTVALEQRMTAWHRCHVSVSRSQQEAALKAIRAEFPEYAARHSHVLQAVLARLDKTSPAFFRRVQRGEKAGFPRFTGRERFHRFTDQEVGNGALREKGFLVRSTIGRLAVRWSRPIAGTPKTVTVGREADGWYVTISGAAVPVKLLPLTGQETGGALGVASFATRADGSQIPTPRNVRVAARVAERTLKRAQRRVSRRPRGSHRRRKAVKRLARAHPRVRRARTDFPHQTARALVRPYDSPYDSIDHEDLQTANLVRNHHLAQSIADAGCSAFLSIRSFQAGAAGKTVVAVPPAYTSPACSGCGVLVYQGWSVRWHECPDGGTSRHRDHNAALHIWRLGREQRRAGPARQALTWPVGVSVA